VLGGLRHHLKPNSLYSVDRDGINRLSRLRSLVSRIMKARYTTAKSLREQATVRLQGVRARATPGTLKRVPIERLAASMDRLRLQGGKPEALKIGRAAVRNLPGSGMAHRFLVRVLLTEPVAPSELVEARSVAEAMVSLWDDPAVSDQYVSVLIAQHAHGITSPDLFEAAVSFFHNAPERRLGPMRRLLNYLIDTNDVDLCSRICLAIAHDPHGANPASLIHEMLLRCELPEHAEALEDRLTSETWAAGELISLLRVARLNRIGHGVAALAVLETQPPHRTRKFSTSYCDALIAHGRHADVLSYLDGNVHNLGEIREVSLRFDALWLLGRIEEAEQTLMDVAEGLLHSLPILRRLLICLGSPEAVTNRFAEKLDALASAGVAGRPHTDHMLAMWFELNEIDRVLAADDGRANVSGLGWLGTYNLARAHYVRRNFDRANQLLDGLSQTARHWEAAKIQSRMLLESGQHEAALKHRKRYPKLGDPLDEVELFSSLHLGNFAEAFGTYLDLNDRTRLVHEFGSKAEFDSFPAGHDRFVIAQNGPGDDIQTFATLGDLARRSGRLTVTCDPRLHPLLLRSFPEISIIPVERLGGRIQAGLLGHDRPARSAGPLYDVLTEEAAKLAHASPKVVFSRSLPQLSVSPGSGHPYPGYLRPDTTRVGRFAERLSELTSPTGLVWRSEISGPMRDIHYLTVDALRPFAELDRDFINLQYDASEEERRVLRQIFGERIVFFDDVDLRNDFEAAAATMAACSAVVGVVTTASELAAAIGTDTILLQPNQFGAWRAQQDGWDYWHESALNACADDHRNPRHCVDVAVSFLREDRHATRRCGL